MSNYTGDIYDMGDVIPGYVDTVYTPHVWYDQSKTYDAESNTNIFEELFIAEGLTIGDAEDKVWSYDEVIEEMMRYLNLHIEMIGYDYYIFDWDTPRNDTSVTWIDIFTGETMNASYSTITLTGGTAAADDTQITMSDVYNQVQVKDNIEKLDTVITSPFDKSKLVALNVKQLYMTEYSSTGSDAKSFIPWAFLLKNDSANNDISNDDNMTWTRKWYMQVYNNPEWSFTKNGVDNYNIIDTDVQTGEPINTWKLLKKMYDEPFISGIVAFGSGKKVNNKNSADIENIDVKDQYICISINGNGCDEVSHTGNSHNEWTAPSAMTPFPSETDIENCGLLIKYNYPTDGTYSPADEAVTNYLVFKGDILMTVPQQTVGPSAGFLPHLHDEMNYYFDTYQEEFNLQTLRAHEDNSHGAAVPYNYVDFNVFYRKNNNFITTRDYIRVKQSDIISGYDFRGRLCPSDENDNKGVYYAQLFYKNKNATESNNRDMGHIYLSPPITSGDLSKRFKYAVGTHNYFDSDVIKYVDVLACQLSIGDKYCEESHDAEGNKVFTWKTVEQLTQENKYHVLQDGTTICDANIFLAINIDDGQFLIGDSHEIYNNIDSSMGLSNITGMAIPMRHEDHLSGELRFSIIGPVNNTWDKGVRRHKTWFRSEIHTSNEVSILPHVGQIWIKSFEPTIVSDHGKKPVGNEKDIIYKSDEQKKYINKKDDIEFKFTTALTAEEATKLQVELTANRSDVTDADGIAILGITNNVTNETDKPEKHYVDAYYREYCDPKLIVDTTLHDSFNINIFNKYNINYMNRHFYINKMEVDVRRATKKLTLKER